MFKSLRDARSLLMGLAIIGVAIFHAPLWFPNRLLRLVHDSLYCGVDVFVFLSGLGACHSVARRGGWGYLRQRARRLLPGLFPVLLVWSLLMTFLGVLNLWELLGSVTLLGWWLGADKQLNWYFSGIWLMYALAPLACRLFSRTKRPLLLWMGLLGASVALGLLWPWDHHRILLSRLPIFFTGILFGHLETTGFARQKLLKGICYGLILPGLLLVAAANWTDLSRWGERLCLWWYPFLLIVPGGCLLVGALWDRLSAIPRMRRLSAPIRYCGESSAEILMFQVAIYKLIQCFFSLSGWLWLPVLVTTLVLGCLYHRFAVPHLGLPSRQKTP